MSKDSDRSLLDISANTQSAALSLANLADSGPEQTSVHPDREDSEYMAESDFESLCKANNLTEDSVAKLVANGLTSIALVKLLRKELLRQACTDWPLGQVLLGKLHSSNGHEVNQHQKPTEQHVMAGRIASQGNPHEPSDAGHRHTGGPVPIPVWSAQQLRSMDISLPWPDTGNFSKDYPAYRHSSRISNNLDNHHSQGMDTPRRESLDQWFLPLLCQDSSQRWQLRFSHHPASAPGPTIDSGHPTVPDLDTLLHLQRSRHQPPLHGQFPGLIDDPTIHLIPQNTIHKGETKPLLIVDYASDLGGPREASEQVLSEHDGQSIVVKSGTKKLKLDNISPAQWIGANARILAELLRQGRLQYHQVPQYLGYTAKIGDLALRYSWLSVLFYDNEYRYLQSQYQFDWGRDAPHLATTRLRERQTASSSSARPSKQGSPICRNYNSKGCTYSNCSFRHICSEAGCGKPRPKSGHTKDA